MRLYRQLISYLKLKLVLLLLVAFYLPFSVARQSSGEMDFDHYVNSVLKNDPQFNSDQIITIGDSLYQLAQNDHQRIRSLFVSISGYHMKADRAKALKYALMADSLAEKSRSMLLSRTNGMVASQYRALKLYDESITYLERALKNAHRLSGKNELITSIMVYNELGAIHYEKKDYRQAIETIGVQIDLIRQAEQAYPDERSRQTFKVHLRPAYLNLGGSYYELDKIDSAKAYFGKAKKLGESTGSPMPPWQEADLYIKLADIEVGEGDPKAALEYLSKAGLLITKLKDRELEHQRDIVLDKYYVLIRDFQQSDSIKKKIINYTAEGSRSATEASRHIFQKMTANAKGFKKRSDLLLMLLLLVLPFLICLLIFSRSRQKKVKERFERILARYESPERRKIKTPIPDGINALPNSPPRSASDRLLSEDKETELLQKLSLFEEGTAFTEKNFTISKLALLLETNTRYVGHILQKHRNKNFNDYLNSLRIAYIMQQLIHNTELLNYKIDYLAEMSGYSSHSRFTQMFKKEVNLSPSQFIRNLSAKQQQTNST